MGEEIFLDSLNKDYVNVRKQNYIYEDGIRYQTGEPYRKGYENSIVGREEVQKELPQLQIDAIMAIWGKVPTIN